LNAPVTLLVSDDAVREALSMERCIELMDETFRRLARDGFHQPLRALDAPAGSRSILGLMPALRRADGVWATKLLCVVPDNPSRGLDSHQGVVVLFDGETGQVRAIANASAVTELRTAAVSAVSARALARPDARVLAIVGAGVQGRSHLHALTTLRPWDEIRIASRTREHAAELAAAHPAAAAAAGVESAVRGADVVVTVTSSSRPVVRREWLAPGAHVIAAGASVRSSRELDTAAVAAATLFVDRRESAENESGDYLVPLEEGAIGPDHIAAELGEVLAGDHPGRTSAEELTLFKSLGIGAEDLAVVAWLAEQGVGHELAL
jgi:ornithine cyclodeaminase/alanine dehydrogenase-like protein (mu-crystallin family)